MRGERDSGGFRMLCPVGRNVRQLGRGEVEGRHSGERRAV